MWLADLPLKVLRRALGVAGLSKHQSIYLHGELL
jgi:hypothetical protein